VRAGAEYCFEQKVERGKGRVSCEKFKGGTANSGTVFAVNTNGGGFTNLHSFTGGSDGFEPAGGLVLSTNTLFGTTGGGGSRPTS